MSMVTEMNEAELNIVKEFQRKERKNQQYAIGIFAGIFLFGNLYSTIRYDAPLPIFFGIIGFVLAGIFWIILYTQKLVPLRKDLKSKLKVEFVGKAGNKLQGRESWRIELKKGYRSIYRMQVQEKDFEVIPLNKPIKFFATLNAHVLVGYEVQE